MKRYLVFGGDSYYPSGGWDDFDDSFDTLVEAIAWGERREFNQYNGSPVRVHDWYHVVDSETWEQVVSGHG